MHIQFSCTGGIANLDLTFQVDTDELPKGINEELQNLIRTANLFNFKSSKRTGADAFSYHLEIEDEKRKNSFSFTDATAPQEVRPLLDYLRNLAMEEKGGE